MSKLPSIAIACAIVWCGLADALPVPKQPRVHSDTEPGVKCLITSERRTLRDALYYPGAYEEGYLQGNNARSRAGSFQSPTREGELARGYTDGYQLKPYAGQQTTIPTVNDVRCGCSTRILKDVLFRTNLDVACKSDRTETESTERSDAYHPQAYNDGYREGIASKANRETYRAKTAGGEFTRGFEDGYFGRANSGQRYTALPIKDYQCQCQLLLKSTTADREN